MNTHKTEEQSDGDLLASFLQSESQKAFATLMNRHAGMVYGVSRRILDNHHQAEDITQAVFVLMARKAQTLRRDVSAAGWLHTVARRLALNALRARTRYQKRERNAVEEMLTDTHDDKADGEALRRELDAGIGKLPDRYRIPLVLFHLEGCSLQEAAIKLKLNVSTVGTRLERAREMLRVRLVRRGVAVGSVSVLVSRLSAEAEGAILPESVATGAMKAVMSGGISVPTATALKGVVITMFISKTKLMVGAITIAILTAAVGTAVIRKQTKKSTDTLETKVATQPHDAISAVPGELTPSTGTTFPTRDLAEYEKEDRPVPEQPVKDDWPKDPSLNFTGPVPFTPAWALELQRVVVLAPGTSQMEAIRERIGMPISPAVYERMLEKQDYAQPSGMRLLGNLCEAMLEEDPATLLLWGKSTGNKEMTMNLLSEWMRKDDSAARAFAQEHLPDEILHKAEARSNEPDPQRDPEAIKAKIAHLEATPDKNQDLLREIYLWSKLQPAEAAAYLASCPIPTTSAEPVSFDTWVSRVAREWAAKDPDAALAWAVALERQEDSTAAFVSIVPSLLRKYPGEEIDISFLPADKRASVIHKIIADWAIADPVSAVAFSSSLEDETLRRSSLKQTVNIWNKQDPSAAQAWVLAQPNDELRDHALSNMAIAAVPNDLKEARRLLSHMREEEDKNSTRVEMVRHGLKYGETRDILEFATELKSVEYGEVSGWVNSLIKRNKEEVEAFRDWVKNAHADGRISYAEYREIGDSQHGYRSLIEKLDGLEQEIEEREKQGSSLL